MSRWSFLWILLPFALVACVTEPAESPSSETADFALAGQWRVESRVISHECPELGSLAPVEPGALEIRPLADGVSMGRPGREGRTYQIESADHWRWQAVATIDSCDVEADTHWRLASSSATAFVADYEATLTATGGDCGAPAQCRVTYQVRGQR